MGNVAGFDDVLQTKGFQNVDYFYVPSFPILPNMCTGVFTLEA